MLEAVVAVLTIVFMQEENNTAVAVALVEEATAVKVEAAAAVKVKKVAAAVAVVTETMDKLVTVAEVVLETRRGALVPEASAADQGMAACKPLAKRKHRASEQSFPA